MLLRLHRLVTSRMVLSARVRAAGVGQPCARSRALMSEGEYRLVDGKTYALQVPSISLSWSMSNFLGKLEYCSLSGAVAVASSSSQASHSAQGTASRSAARSSAFGSGARKEPGAGGVWSPGVDSPGVDGAELVGVETNDFRRLSMACDEGGARGGGGDEASKAVRRAQGSAHLVKVLPQIKSGTDLTQTVEIRR